MQEMVYLKAVQKSAPMGVSVSGTTDQKTYQKKFRKELQPPPLDPPLKRSRLQSLLCEDTMQPMVRMKPKYFPEYLKKNKTKEVYERR